MTSFAAIADQLVGQAIELPSWAFGNSGTRFKVFSKPGTPRTMQEKIADAAKVHELTGSPRRSRCTSRGTRWTTTRTPEHAEELVIALEPSTRTRSRMTLQVRQPDPLGSSGPTEGDRPSFRVHRDHAPDRVRAI